MKTNINLKDYDTGVIIGRFQVHQLHEGHKDLIKTVSENHRKTILFLGISSVRGSKRNPLDFITRKLMIQSDFPNITILPLPDQHEDKLWSNELDKRILETVSNSKVVLYGSRDSFIPFYLGKFPTYELESKIITSGTEVRKHVAQDILSDPAFRAGIIYASYNRYDISFQTVDVAIQNDKNEFLFARKPNENGIRFVGGFVDPKDQSLEIAAKREAQEETGLEVEIEKYLGSFRVNDWRYRSESDKIMTTLFIAKSVFGSPQANDDISELHWLSSDDVIALSNLNYKYSIEPVHMPLLKVLVSHIQNKKNN